MKKMLKEKKKKLYYLSITKEYLGKNPILEGDSSELYGNCSKLKGNCSGLSGNCSGIKGDCSEFEGNLNACKLTEEDRVEGIDITNLVK